MQRLGQRAILGADLQGGQAPDVPTLLTEEVRVVVGEGLARVPKLVSPDSVAEVHAPQDATVGQVRQNAPDRCLVVDVGQLRHDLFVGHGALPLVERDQHRDSRGGGSQSSLPEQGAHLALNLFEIARQLTLRLRERNPISGPVAAGLPLSEQRPTVAMLLIAIKLL